MVVNGLRPGAAVQVRAADPRDLRFLYGTARLAEPRAAKYTMRSGEAGVTFLSCVLDQETFPARGYTDYYGGFLVRGMRCAPGHGHGAWLAAPGQHPVRRLPGARPGAH